MRRLAVALLVAVVALVGLTPTADAALARRITLKATPTAVAPRAVVTFSGAVTHTPKGGKVVLQRRSGTRWVAAKTSRTTTRGGAYRIRLAMPSTPATYSFRAVAPKTSKLRPATSPTRSVRVRSLPAPPSITTASLTDGVAGQAYSVALVVAGSPAGTWTAAPLPAGLSLDPASGVISGTPSTTGTTQVTIGFTQASTGLSASVQLPLTIAAAPAVPVIILTTTLPDAQQNAAYSAQLHVSAGVAGTWTASPLPAGLSVDPATGVISGTPSGTGTTQVTVGFTQANTGTAASPVQVALTVGTVNPREVQVSAGGMASCRITVDTALWCWGYDDAGEVGDGGPLAVDPPGVLAPEQLAGTGWQQVTVSSDNLPTESHACAIRGAQDAGLCWGDDASGQLGDGGGGAETAPVAISGGYRWAQLSAGWTNTCGVTTGGALYCWGDDSYSQSGTGGSTVVPTRVGTDFTWVGVATGYNSSCAVKVDGTLWCWGANFRGQLGTGDNVSQPAPTQVGTGTGWTQVSVGVGDACAVKADGTLWCWGPSSYGELGNGTDVNSPATDELSPHRVGNLKTWTQVSAGRDHTCGLSSAGTAWCWGKGDEGELGDGIGDGTSSHDATTPVQAGSGSGWTSVSAGATHSCGVASGTVECWGSNAKGRLGIGVDPSVTALANVPTAVVG